MQLAHLYESNQDFGGNMPSGSHTKEDSIALAELQRGEPEVAMENVQFAMGGGVLNPVVEHIGDLNHRMNEFPTWETAGYRYVKEKVERGLGYLKFPYGFAKEFEENIVNNARYRKVPVEQLRAAVTEALKRYAEAHSRLPVYNHAHELARDACVALGNMQWEVAIDALEELEGHLGSVREWVRFAREGLSDGNV